MHEIRLHVEGLNPQIGRRGQHSQADLYLQTVAVAAFIDAVAMVLGHLCTTVQ